MSTDFLGLFLSCLARSSRADRNTLLIFYQQNMVILNLMFKKWIYSYRISFPPHQPAGSGKGGTEMRSTGIRANWLVQLAGLTLLLGTCFVQAARGAEGGGTKPVPDNLSQEVRHQLVMLPYYSVFDNLEYEVQGDGTVVLSGEVVRPTLKSDAAAVVRNLPGVEKVENKIQVLPLSPSDDRIRVAVYRAIFSNDQLYRYELRAVPPIHIIVKNGNVTLVGTVATQADKDVANVIANTVPGVFSVKNDLTVENRRGKP
jgi:hyperosmotically inducible protein